MTDRLDKVVKVFPNIAERKDMSRKAVVSAVSVVAFAVSGVLFTSPVAQASACTNVYQVIAPSDTTITIWEQPSYNSEDEADLRDAYYVSGPGDPDDNGWAGLKLIYDDEEWRDLTTLDWANDIDYVRTSGLDWIYCK